VVTLLILIGTTQTHKMAQETNILIQVSNDGATWTDLVTLSNGTVSHKHSGLTLGTTKYYRTIAKGDGVNTLDSDPSTVVNVASGFVQRYQDVLNYASTNSIGVPSFVQNVINDNKYRNLIRAGFLHEPNKSLDKLNVFWVFKQEAGTPYEFMTLNWRDASKHRLVNQGTNNVSFIGGSGFKAAGSNSQIMGSDFYPSLDADIMGLTDSSMFFKTFDIPTTYVSPSRIAGADHDDSASQIMAQVVGYKGLMMRLFDKEQQDPYGDMNNYFYANAKGDKNTFFENSIFSAFQSMTLGRGATKTTAELKLFGATHINIPYPTEAAVGLEYFGLGKDVLYDQQELTNILRGTYNFESSIINRGIKVTIADTSGFPSLYYPKVYKSDPFKTYFTGLTKKYIVFYSTNHEDPGSAQIPANGAIGWGECDHPDLSGYVDKGIVAKDTPNPIAGYQSETPSVIINPNDPNGQHIWFFYHPTNTFPDAGGIQQTRLLTASGGIGFNDVLFTDRGKVLGITTTESGYSVAHTGYADAYVEADGSVLIIHSTKNWSADTEVGIPNIGKSTCPGNSYVFTRIDSDMDITSFMPYFRQFHHGPSLFFIRNSIQYAVCRNASFIINDVTTSSKISLFQCDGSYHPSIILGNISGVDSGNDNSNAGYYIEGDTLYVYYIKNLTDLYVGTWDLKNLD